jgi:hypothetical protein
MRCIRLGRTNPANKERPTAIALSGQIPDRGSVPLIGPFVAVCAGPVNSRGSNLRALTSSAFAGRRDRS